MTLSDLNHKDSIKSIYVDYLSNIGDLFRIIAMLSLIYFVIDKKIKLPNIFVYSMMISFIGTGMFTAYAGHVIRSFTEWISFLSMMYIAYIQFYYSK